MNDSLDVKRGELLSKSNRSIFHAITIFKMQYK